MKFFFLLLRLFFSFKFSSSLIFSLFFLSLSIVVASSRFPSIFLRLHRPVLLLLCLFLLPLGAGGRWREVTRPQDLLDLEFICWSSMFTFLQAAPPPAFTFSSFPLLFSSSPHSENLIPSRILHFPFPYCSSRSL